MAPPAVHHIAHGDMEIIPVYQWDDGWWIGRALWMDPSARSSRQSRDGYIPDLSSWFVLVDPQNPQVRTSELIARREEVSQPLWFIESEGWQMDQAKRWHPFVRDVLWLDSAEASPPEFPAFVDDAIFEPIPEEDLKHIFSVPEEGAEVIEKAYASVYDLLKSVFGSNSIEVHQDQSTGVKVGNETLNFWWHWGRPSRPWRMNRESKRGEQGGVLTGESLADLIHQMKSIGTEPGTAPYRVPILLPASTETTWGPPGRLIDPIDLSTWRLLGLPSPFLQPTSDFVPWMEATGNTT